ncbi:hypothetical protein SEA_SOJO_47 [Streptomyces phage SoJo]|nr:hypothetical protein SEA_SOJO_47 [Streptomyces phage SoJo]
MSPRPQQRAPKGRNRDRDDRRAVLDVLLARAQRGVLSAAEGALLAQHVREEQRLADENRRAMAGTTQALERHREAADAAIVEAEERAAAAERKLSDSETLGHRLLQRAERAEDELRGHRAAAEYRKAAADTFEGRLAALRQQTTEGVLAGFEALTKRAENAEQQLAGVRSQLHDVKARRDDARAGRQDAERALARVRQAQTLGDALAVVAQFDGLSPEAARTHGRILDQADTVEARLAEQQREHDVALAVAEQRATASERTAEQHRRALAAVLARPAGTPFGELTEYAAKTLTRSGERILDAEHRATRYRTAWLAARRDRKADRAAMAAELPAVQAGYRALAVADELFVAGRTPAERDAGRCILAAVQRECTTRATVADELADALFATTTEQPR